MRLMPVMTLAFALAIAFSMVALSGVGTELGHNPQSGIDGEFNDTAEDAEDQEFDPESGSGSLLGSTVAAINVLQSAVGVLVYMPNALQSIGFPGWFAELTGRTIQIIIALGIAQVVRGFEIR